MQFFDTSNEVLESIIAWNVQADNAVVAEQATGALGAR